jgi:isopentenyldiphosphate isomerase
MAEEVFEIVDENGCVIGLAPRSACHGNPQLIHQSVHVLVFHRDGRLLLQKRSGTKDVQPGKWDTSVGGHMQPGERPEQAALRETHEELGILPAQLTFAYQYHWRSAIETELVRAYATIHHGPFSFQPSEIDEGRFWSFAEIEAQLDTGTFTDQFCKEFARMRDWWTSRHPGNKTTDHAPD